MKSLKLLLISAVFLLGETAFCQTEDVSSLIRQRVENGMPDKTVSTSKLVLFSQNVLPVFYQNRDFAPAWDDPVNVSELLENLNSADLEGLHPADYHLEDLESLLSRSELSPVEQADLDMLLTDALLLYASHLILGKVDQSKINPGWDIPPNQLPANADSLLRTALANHSITDQLNRVKPNHFMYTELRKGLARYREIAAKGGWPQVSAGETLKKGMSGPRVAELRNYLAVTGDLPVNSSDSIFDDTLEMAVKRFQLRHNLIADGAVGKNTLAQINVPVEKRIDQIRINLERSRWVVHELEPDFLVVNIAGFNLRRVTNDSIVFYSRVIVGKSYKQSPIFKGRMTYFVINPTWTLPYSIATHETLPKLKKDPGYLAAKNMEILDKNGKPLDPSTIDFSQYSTRNFPFTIRQKAGPHNALGRIKFMFPNHYSVYLHDTPARSLFGREERAFSHGCIRLERTWDLLFNLTDDPEVWNMDRVNELLKSGETVTEKLKHPIDILILYWTAGGDKEGRLFFNKDVYDRDPAVLKALDQPVTFQTVL